MIRALSLNADRRELSRIQFQPDPLVLNTQEINLGDSRKLIELLAEILRDILHFALRKALAGDGNGRNGNVAEIAVDERADDTVWQFDLDVAHLVAEPLPGPVDVADLVLKVDVDVSDPRSRAFGYP